MSHLSFRSAAYFRADGNYVFLRADDARGDSMGSGGEGGGEVDVLRVRVRMYVPCRGRKGIHENGGWAEMERGGRRRTRPPPPRAGGLRVGGMMLLRDTWRVAAQAVDPFLPLEVLARGESAATAAALTRTDAAVAVLLPR